MTKLERNIVFRMIVFLYAFACVLGLFVYCFKFKQFLISGSFYYICLIAVLLYTVKFIEKKSLESIGLDLHRIFKKAILGIGIFTILEIVFTLYFFVVYKEKPNFVHLPLGQTLLYTIYHIFLVGITEELIFRGYLLQRLSEMLNSKLYAVLSSSFLFALWHFPSNYSWGQVIFAFLFGLILSTVKVKTKENSIVSLAIGHGLYNSFIYLVGFFIK